MEGPPRASPSTIASRCLRSGGGRRPRRQPAPPGPSRLGFQILELHHLEVLGPGSGSPSGGVLGLNLTPSRGGRRQGTIRAGPGRRGERNRLGVRPHLQSRRGICAAGAAAGRCHSVMTRRSDRIRVFFKLSESLVRVFCSSLLSVSLGIWRSGRLRREPLRSGPGRSSTPPRSDSQLEALPVRRPVLRVAPSLTLTP